MVKIIWNKTNKTFDFVEDSLGVLVTLGLGRFLDDGLFFAKEIGRKRRCDVCFNGSEYLKMYNYKTDRGSNIIVNTISKRMRKNMNNIDEYMIKMLSFQFEGLDENIVSEMVKWVV